MYAAYSSVGTIFLIVDSNNSYENLMQSKFLLYPLIATVRHCGDDTTGREMKMATPWMHKRNKDNTRAICNETSG